MKRIFLVLALCVSSSVASHAGGSFGLGPHVGVSFSSFPKAISDFYGTGFLFGAHGELGFLPFLGVRLSLDYATFGADKNKVIGVYVQANQGTQASDFGFEGLRTSIFSIYADGKGKIPTGAPVTPYGLVGIGLNFVSTSEGMVTYQNTAQPQANIPSNSETDFGLNFGAGADVSLGVVTLYGEVKYVLVFTKNESSSHLPIVVGATFGL